MKKQIRKISIIAIAAYWLCALLLSWVAGDAFRFSREVSTSVVPSGVVGDMLSGFTLTQRFQAQGDEIDSIALRFADYGRQNTGNLSLTIKNEEGETVAQADIDVSQVRDGAFYTVCFPEPVAAGWHTLTLTALDGTADNFVSVYYGNAMETARGSVAQSYGEEEKL
ncbi:MAG: hypothetical protein RR350_09410, partial [Oscillibacter sp.]